MFAVAGVLVGEKPLLPLRVAQHMGTNPADLSPPDKLDGLPAENGLLEQSVDVHGGSLLDGLGCP